MRRILASLLVAAIGFAAPPSVASAAPAPAGESPEALYDEGRKAYRLGDYKTAVDKWQRAYDLVDSSQEGAVAAALLLYNISLAYKGLYSITEDIADLRRAKAVIENFITIANANPDVELDDAQERRDELERMIAEAEAAQEKDEPPPPVVGDDAAIKSLDLGDDPGRQLRLAGIGTMAGGGAIAITGLGLALFYSLKGREFSEQLRIDNATFQMDGCNQVAIAPGSPCDDLRKRIEYWRVNGRKANNLAVGLGAGLGGVGAVALIVGGLVYNEGNKRTKLWEKAGGISLLPAPDGIVLTGRF